MRSLIISVLIMSGILLSGCQKYTETQTPPGQPLPPAPTSQVAPSPAINVPDTPNPSGNSRTIPSRKSRADAKKVDSEVTITEFSKVYAANNSPRIAYLFNHPLSEDVRQWRTNERLVVTGDGEKISIAGSRNDSDVNVQAGTVNINSKTPGQDKIKIEGSSDKTRSVTVQGQQYIEEGKRPGQDGQWAWVFEDGVLDAFLQAKANVVDRATILRLTALQSGDDSEISAATPKRIEMNALQEYADIYIEVNASKRDLSGDNNKGLGIELKAKAVEVKSGKILASISNVARDELLALYYVSQQSGAPIRESVWLDAVGDVANRVAVEIMKDMTKAWGN
jgi:hypothetical protein